MCRSTSLVLALALALVLTACGGETVTSGRVPDDWQRDCQGKPAPPIGGIELRIVERIAPDRVVLEARWEPGRDAVDGTVELVLPDGAWLLEGPDLRTRARMGRDGVRRWTVEHRVGEPLDAVARLRRDVGEQRRAREACVRLASRSGD